VPTQIGIDAVGVAQRDHGPAAVDVRAERHVLMLITGHGSANHTCDELQQEPLQARRVAAGSRGPLPQRRADGRHVAPQPLQELRPGCRWVGGLRCRVGLRR